MSLGEYILFMMVVVVDCICQDFMDKLIGKIGDNKKYIS